MRKRVLPKPVLKKRMMKGFFWFAFCVCLFLSIVAIARVSNSEAAADQRPVVQPQKSKPESPNQATGVGAQTFAKNFTNDYLTWQIGDNGAKDHAKRLKPYLAKGLDEQAGVQVGAWSSEADGIEIVRIQETGKQTANVIVRVDQSLSQTQTIEPTDEAIKKAKKNDKKPPKPQEKTVTKGPYEKYLAVPVKAKGGGFAVYEIPHFVPAPMGADISVQTPNFPDPVNDDQLTQDVTTFLKTFFKVYTTGSTEELSYYTKIPQPRPLTGVVSFGQIKDLAIYPTEESNTYCLHVNISMTSSEGTSTFVYPYTLRIQKDHDRWFVLAMKHQ